MNRIRSHKTGKDKTFTIIQSVEVEVDAEFVINIPNLVEKITEDEEALKAVIQEIKKRGYIPFSEPSIKDSDMEAYVAFLYENCWKFTVEEDTYIQNLAEKYGFIPNLL